MGWFPSWRHPGRTLPELGILFFSFLAILLGPSAYHIRFVNVNGEIFRYDNMTDPSSNEVRILTYNVFMRPGLTPSNLVDDAKDERLKYFKDVLSRFDIIAFEEMFATASGRRAKLVRVAEEAGFPYTVATPPPKLTKWKRWADGGVFLLSRFPIVEKDVLIFKRGVQADVLAQKGAVYSRIQVLDGEGESHFLNVFATHLQASYANNKSDRKNFMCRESQLEQLREFMEKKLKGKEDETAVLLGDLNVDGIPATRKLSVCSSTPSTPRRGSSIIDAFSDSKSILSSAPSSESDEIASNSTSTTETTTTTTTTTTNDEIRFSPEGYDDDLEARHSASYLYMLKKLTPRNYRLRDLAYEAHSFHPVTTGDILVTELDPNSEESEHSTTTQEGWMSRTAELFAKRHSSGSKSSAEAAMRRLQRRAESKMRRILKKSSKLAQNTIDYVIPPPMEPEKHPEGDVLRPSLGEKPRDLFVELGDGDSGIPTPDSLSSKLFSPMEFSLTHPMDYCTQGSIDYIFVIEPEKKMFHHPTAAAVPKNGDDCDCDGKRERVVPEDMRTSSSNRLENSMNPERKLTPIPSKTFVEKFVVHGTPAFTQLSDHYGMSCVFSIASPHL